MKLNVEISPDELLRLQTSVNAASVKCALLEKELNRVMDERDYYHGLVLAAHLLEKMAGQKEAVTVIPILLSKIPKVLSCLETMEEIRLVQCTLLQLLSDDTPAEILKLLNDAIPKQLHPKELVKVEVKESGDVIAYGGTKNVNGTNYKKGGETDDTDKNSER